MREYYKNPNSIVPIDAVDVKRFTGMHHIADMIARGKQPADPIESHLLANALPHLSVMTRHGTETTGFLIPHVLESFALRRTTGHSADPGYMLRNIEFTLDHMYRSLFPEDYPYRAHEAAFWQEADPISHINVFTLSEELRKDLQSSMPDAYAIYHILSVLLQSRWSNPTVLDNGSSLGLGLRKWLSNGFDPIKVYQQPDKGMPLAPELLVPDSRMQAIVDQATAAAPTIGTAVGYDAEPIDPRDTHAIDRLFSHIFPMSESIKRPDEVREFHNLIATMPHNMVLPQHFIDARDPDTLEALQHYLPGGNKADIGIFSAMLFEHSPQMVRHILDNIRPYFNPGGLVFITDFARENRNETNGIKFIRQNWWHHPGSFATFVLDPHQPEQPPREIARFLTRRATEMWLTPFGEQLFETGEIN